MNSNSEKTVKKYIENSFGYWLLTSLYVILVAAVVFFINIKKDMPELLKSNGSEVVSFSSDKEAVGNSAYFQAIGISDWIYKFNNIYYYFAVDENGKMIVAKINKQDADSMTSQRSYFENTDLNEKPVSVRLSGMTREMPVDLVEKTSKELSISIHEFREMVGYCYLDTVDTSTERVVFVVFALILGVMLTVVVLYSAYSHSGKRSLKLLKKRNMLDDAAADLTSDLACESFIKDRVRMSDRFIFAKKTGLGVPWEDVLWVYPKLNMFYGATLARNLMVATSTGKEHMINCRKEADLKELMDRISQHCPQAMMGYSRDNRKRYKERVKYIKQHQS